MVTFDALHTVRANLDWLAAEKKAHYIAVVKKNQPLLYARVKALPWRQVPAGSFIREAGHGRIETRTLKTAHVSRLDFPWARQAMKITRRPQDTATGKTSRETVYAVTSLTSTSATAQDLTRLVREHWSVEAHHHVRDVTFSEDTATSRTSSGPANLATIRAAIIAAIKDAATCTSPKDGATTPPPPKLSASTASIKTEADIHGTRRSPGYRRGRAPGERRVLRAALCGQLPLAVPAHHPAARPATRLRGSCSSAHSDRRRSISTTSCSRMAMRACGLTASPSSRRSLSASVLPGSSTALR